MRNFPKPGTIIGYRKNGLPIRLIAGGSMPLETDPLDDPQGLPTAPTAPDGYFTAEDLQNAQQKAREEEKNKLYKTVEKTKADAKAARDELTQLRTWRQEQEKALQTQREAEEAAQQRAAEEEMSAKDLIKAKEREWQQRLDALEADRQQERAALEKEREFSALRAYISQRAREVTEARQIAPELIDLITGSTQDEVEQSIANLTDKTNAILANLNLAKTEARASQRGVSTAGYAATGPMDNEPGTKTLSPQEIKDMSMSDWQKIRGNFGVSGSQTSHRGLFG